MELATFARGLAAEVGVTPVSPGTGAMLAMLASVGSSGSARAVIEIGTGTGVSALWLLRGMHDGVLTTIDIEGEYQRVAKRIFAEAGYLSGRTRLITGRGSTCSPAGRPARTTCCSSTATATTTPSARRPRPGCCAPAACSRSTACWRGRVADPTARDVQTVALRELVKSFRDHEEWSSALTPVGDGLLIAVRR